MATIRLREKFLYKSFFGVYFSDVAGAFQLLFQPKGIFDMTTPTEQQAIDALLNLKSLIDSRQPVEKAMGHIKTLETLAISGVILGMEKPMRIVAERIYEDWANPTSLKRDTWGQRHIEANLRNLRGSSV